MDDTTLGRGGEIDVELVKAIQLSRMSVIVFSRNYADSRWCLDELLKILECKKIFQQMVAPVFYGVEPQVVRAEKGSFAEAFAKHEERYEGGEMQYRVKRWRAALAEAANLSGWDIQHIANGYESKFIEKIVEDISNTLNIPLSNVGTNPVSIESHVGQHDVRMLRSQGISRMDAPPLEKKPTEVTIEEVSDVSDGPQQKKAKNIAQKSPRERIPPKTQKNNRAAVKEQSGFNRPFESSADIKIACLSESAPLIIEDTDSIFADLDQIISDASSQAASTSAMKPRGEADKAPPSQEEMDKAKAILEKSLSLNFELLLHPSRRGKFLEAISILTSFSDFSSDKVSALEKFQSNFPSLASNFQSSEKKLEEYQKWIYSKVSLLETLKNHVADYKALKTKQESDNEEIKKLQQELKLREEENKKIISKKQELAKETQVMKSTLAKYNTEASSWEENKKKAEDTCSHVFCSWENFKKNFV